MKIKFKTVLLLTLLLGMAMQARASEILGIETDYAELEVRVFPADGDTLLLGFPCDEGSSVAEEKTAAALAEDGIEVWMPDLLTAYMLPRVQSSLAEIPDEALLALLEPALATGKKVYLIASGPDTVLMLRAAHLWQEQEEVAPLAGGILLFPRLFAETPEPGSMPKYVAAVGQTQLPLFLMEGERTPNRWGLDHLVQALQQGGSPVIVKLVPGVRGYFFKRADANRSEEVVTSQLAGLIKVSLFYLKEEAYE